VAQHPAADADGVAAVRDLGGVGVRVLIADGSGTVTTTLHT
jgi:hypothetical protein